MILRLVLAGGVLLAAESFLFGQQIPDLKYQPELPRPAYDSDKGPHVSIDEAHHNFHTVGDRYRPFAELLRRDGYRVDGFEKPFSSETLRGVDVLVVANALHERNVDDWSLPTPSAFSTEEVEAVRAWVEQGGSLLLIADHMPFPGAAGELAKSFGIEFSNGYASAGHWERGKPNRFEKATGLKESAVTRGRDESEAVTSVTTFGGSAFKLPKDAIPILMFGENSQSVETKKAPGVTPDAPRVPIDGWSQGALLKIGQGRVAIFGEAAMFSAQLSGPQENPMGMNSPDAKQNHQLLLNVLHWLTHLDGMPE